MTEFFWGYFALISLIGLIVTAADKHRAVHGGWRVPERTLLLLGALGGAAVMYLTMRLIRHKTRHPKFMVGLPMIFLLQLIFLWTIFKFF